MTELESRQAFQDDTLQALNDAVVQQRREIDRLQLQMQELIRRFTEVAGQLPGESEDVPPPHY
ncbi:hypothetical protein HAQ06_09895 [Pseudomonas sp. C2L12B]|uniref:Protein SlyX homolog n=1 Tax=Pseudomonas typographi TaxID=2715964 RepID=A0ABR7Z5E5_9PSED|nr:hypothetical protein [Pseudomonas typographi]MBD1586968.1 hypothetical protein [Pseudomonas typographi]MBD1600573.1 hypothetical protein [Pseudomonas typographi]